MNGPSRRILLTAGVSLSVVAGMLGLTFASPSLYRLFCQATGYDGTPKTVNVARPAEVADQMVTVRFDANVNSSLPWRFQAAQREVHIHLGEERLVHYTATNLSDEPLTGMATFNIVPEKAAQYFSKIQCFCFTQQTLQPGQEVSMPVLFYVDPQLAQDPTAKDATIITLSYTFYPADGEADSKGNSAKVAATRTTGAGG
jgi:cytochrome c oxidase assembly protein subunit 11